MDGHEKNAKTKFGFNVVESSKVRLGFLQDNANDCSGASGTATGIGVYEHDFTKNLAAGRVQWNQEPTHFYSAAISVLTGFQGSFGGV